MNENESELITFFIQTRVLVWKNMMLFKRKIGVFLFIILTPIAVGFMLSLMVDVASMTHSQGAVEPPVEKVGKVPACGERGDFDPRIHEPCVSVGYGFIGQYKDVNDPAYSKYHNIMKIFAKDNGFKFGHDVKALTAGGQQDIFDYLDNNKNQT